jgi:hypothetical protein
MIVAGQRLPILIATRPVEFRCGHNALALIVQTELKLDLVLSRFSSGLFRAMFAMKEIENGNEIHRRVSA